MDLRARDTIAAVATATGPGAVAIVRASGPAVRTLRDMVFVPRQAGAWSHARLRLGEVRDPVDGTLLDEGLAAWFEAGRSYTGEELLELQVHGGTLNARRVLEAVLSTGARLAEPGEFSFRALRSGRLDLSQAEAVQQLVAADSETARTLALRALRGSAAQTLAPLRELGVEVLAAIEASLDFGDDEVTLDSARLQQQLAALLEALAELRATHHGAQALLERPRVVLTGPPNAGKSTLLNALARSDRAIVHATPGTTRDVLEHGCTVDGQALILVDTAGVREAVDDIEAEALVRARRAVESADLCLIVIDASLSASDDTLRAMDAARPGDLVVLNKSDRGFQTVWAALGEYGCRVSALTGEGLELLRARIAQRTRAPAELLARDWVVTTQRHALLLDEAAQWVERSRQELAQAQAPELVAESLRRGLRALEHIVGGDLGEDTLRAIFERFCIGK
ncbi:MAG: tRNA uridine-5-carboxymethylaminomethyl(34) synthesis GTPase MnmE [Pseudomonadota bacterium]